MGVRVGLWEVLRNGYYALGTCARGVFCFVRIRLFEWNGLSGEEGIVVYPDERMMVILR